jgi:hypothetical protein
MYTNIDTEHAFIVITAWMSTSPIPVQAQINVPALLTGLRLIMSYNVFCFGDTFWHQLTGTAMGTPPAPMYATLYFCIHEMLIIPKYQHRLIYYCRYIDDGFGIWIPSPCNTTHATEWQHFTSDFDQFGSLRWEFSKLSTTTSFLDVTILLRHDYTIETCLFEKALNLYLYLPAHSAHPPGILKGLICGMFYRIQRLTSDPTARLEQTRRLYKRLRLRGHSAATLQPLFETAVIKTQQQKPPSLPIPPTTFSPLFLHVPFHPCDPPSQHLQQNFRRSLLYPRNQPPFSSLRTADGHAIPISQMIVAYHRPRNLGNILSPRRFDTLGMSVAEYLSTNN